MLRSILTIACGTAIALSSIGTARADPEWGRWHRHGGWYGRPVVVGPTYYAPPAYYAPPVYVAPPVVYAPPPAYYAPPALGMALALPGVSIGVNVPLH